MPKNPGTGHSVYFPTGDRCSPPPLDYRGITRLLCRARQQRPTACLSRAARSTRACLLRGTKKRPPHKDGLIKIWSPVPFYPHPRGGIEILLRIVCTQGPIRYSKLNFLDCCKFTGAFLGHIVVSSPLSAHYYSIRPKAGRPSPSPDTPWPPSLRSLTFKATNCDQPAYIRAWGSFSWGEPPLSPEQP
jgi:hypothetical protein